MREKLYSNQVRKKKGKFVKLIGKTSEITIMNLSNYFENFLSHYNFKNQNLFDANLQLIETKPVLKTK